MQETEPDASAAGPNKRKAHGRAGQKLYAESESSEEDEPLVRHALQRQPCLRPPAATLFAAVVFNG